MGAGARPLRIHRSEDGGRSWAGGTVLETKPFVGGYGMRGGIVLADGTIVLPLGDVPTIAACSWFAPRTKAPHGRRPSGCATLPDRRFRRAGAAPARVGTRPRPTARERQPLVVAQLVRRWRPELGEARPDRDRRLSCPSDRPARWPYPLHLRLSPPALRHTRDHIIRRRQYLVIACRGQDGLPNSDLGYPCILPTAAALCTVYYAQDQNECTYIFVIRWTLPTHI